MLLVTLNPAAAFTTRAAAGGINARTGMRSAGALTRQAPAAMQMSYDQMAPVGDAPVGTSDLRGASRTTRVPPGADAVQLVQGAEMSAGEKSKGIDMSLPLSLPC